MLWCLPRSPKYVSGFETSFSIPRTHVLFQLLQHVLIASRTRLQELQRHFYDAEPTPFLLAWAVTTVMRTATTLVTASTSEDVQTARWFFISLSSPQCHQHHPFSSELKCMARASYHITPLETLYSSISLFFVLFEYVNKYTRKLSSAVKFGLDSCQSRSRTLFLPKIHS